MEYGVTNRLQVGVDLSSQNYEEEISQDSSKWNTVNLGVLYQIVESNSPFALSASIAFGIPIKSGAQVDYQPTILVAKTLHRLQLHASVESVRDKSSFQYNLGSVYPIHRFWFPTLEFNGQESAWDRSPLPHSGTLSTPSART